MKAQLFYRFFFFLCLQLTCQSQETNLYLKLVSKDSTETLILDSIPYQKVFKNYAELNTEIDSVQNILHSKGYLDHVLLETKKISDSLIKADFELQEKYKKITIYYDSQLIPKEIIRKNAIEIEKNYFTARIKNVEKILGSLTSFIVNQGMTFGNVSLETIEKKDNQLFANLHISKSKNRTIDQFIIKGYEKFPMSYIKYYTGIKKGRVFKKQEILDKSYKLDNLKFVKNNKPPEVLFDKDSTTVYFYLTKEKANTFDGFLGFSSDNESNDLELNGYLNLHLINNLNFGEELRLIYKNDGNDQQRFEVTTSLPYIIKTPLGIEAGLNIFRKDTTFLITEQNLNLNYLLSDKSKLFVGYETIDSNNLLDIPRTDLFVEDYSSSFLRTGFSFTKTQNNSLFPILSNYAILTQFGSRKTEAGKTDQIKGQIILNQIFRLNERNSIFVRNTSAAIFSDQYLTNELYRFGGINSMRGFEENTINASLYNVLNTEYRYVLSSNLYIHSIIDYSYFEDDSISISDNLTSVGFGLGLQTATGIFRIIFANGKNNNQSFTFSNTKVHLSLNASF